MLKRCCRWVLIHSLRFFIDKGQGTAETTSLVDSDVQHSFLSLVSHCFAFVALRFPRGDTEALDASHDDDGHGQHIHIFIIWSAYTVGGYVSHLTHSRRCRSIIIIIDRDCLYRDRIILIVVEHKDRIVSAHLHIFF